jgi:uncharacterized protein YgbK (DUF1537 family)
LHPIRSSDVAAHVERDTALRCHTVSLPEVRNRRRLLAAIERARAGGCRTFVCDAETDDDLDRALDVVLERARPVVLAGSLGLGAALRRRLQPRAGSVAAVVRRRPGGTLVVVGSAHPTARLQSEALGCERIYEIADGEGGAAAGRRAAAAFSGGAPAVLCMPAEIGAGAGPGLLASMGGAVAACVEASAPGALVLVGGETAHAVLQALAQPGIRVVHALGPLIVGGEFVGGRLAGTPVVTKGGSAGDASSLVRAVEWLGNAGR